MVSLISKVSSIVNSVTKVMILSSNNTVASKVEWPVKTIAPAKVRIQIKSDIHVKLLRKCVELGLVILEG